MATNKGASEIITAKITMFGVIIAATIGLIGVLVTAIVGYKGNLAQVNLPIEATQTAEASLNSRGGLEGTPLPYNLSPSFSVSVYPSFLCMHAGIIEFDIDRTKYEQTTDSGQISFPGDKYDQYGYGGNFPNTVSIILNGTSSNSKTYISNRIPIKVVSYETVPDTIDLRGISIGGGDDVYMFAIELSSKSINNINQISWATYPSDLQELLINKWNAIEELEAPGTDIADQFYDVPLEIRKIASGDSTNLPDYYSIEKDEMLVFSAANFFKDPGIYTLQYGIEYVYDGYSNIIWADPPIRIYVPNNYFYWLVVPSLSNTANEAIYLNQYCSFSRTEGHTCETICEYTINGLSCKNN